MNKTASIPSRAGTDELAPVKSSVRKKAMNLDVATQLELADKIIGMLVSRIHKDETTDYTGFTITKKAVGEHAGKVIRDIERGALQEVKLKGFKYE